ncbi:MAG: shikimate kinase [Bacteroidetes bacterium]|jgi:shikimate kinase|nr:MAG: shikimate kinase [Bacteroidota bacterium]
MKIILLGYMGSGKSTIGQTLANELNLSFVDLDHAIEKEIGMSIRDFFEASGELKFRRLENDVLKKVILENSSMILSTGGGTPCYGNNLELMKSALKTKVFYLKASIKTLSERLVSEKDMRPLIQAIGEEDLPEFIGKHLFERSNFYLQAHHVIDIDQKSVETIAKEIVELL